jgi:hypothetical protein
MGSLMVKEVKKRSLKNMKSTREAPLRAKKLVREMQVYWRKSEKDVSWILIVLILQLLVSDLVGGETQGA